MIDLRLYDKESRARTLINNNMKMFNFGTSPK